jgi:glutamate dehydrogenase (NADP+)
MTISSRYQSLQDRYAHQPLFAQAVEEVMASLAPHFESTGVTPADVARLERLLIPERIITFKVLWTSDTGSVQHNVGWRVQFNSALGPYKGGLRFDASVSEDVLKFLGFEQIFKNSLTGLPLGGGKGGSDFNPKGKSDNEIRTFCRAFMVELHRHIGIDIDVPAGDMGVGGREIGYMMGMYKELTGGRYEGVLTGKPVEIGGSLGRTEATGHGVVYFAKAMLKEQGKLLSGMRCVVSGSGNVAEHTARKLVADGAVVLTMSDRTGYIYKEGGLTEENIDAIVVHKESGASLDTFDNHGIVFSKKNLWQSVEADAYFPCATQNEITVADAEAIAKHAQLVVEGANMPLANNAIKVLHDARIPHAPGKASNAGGVAVSGLEMVQNTSHYPWTRERVEEELQNIMHSIHDQCLTHGRVENTNYINYLHGANIAGAMRVLNAMEKLGW